MSSKSFWKWAMVIAALLPIAFVAVVGSLSPGDLAQGQDSAWTTTTLGQAGAKARDIWFDSDLAVDSRDPNNPDDDNIYIANTRWQGDVYVTHLHVSKDGGKAWARYVLRESELAVQARVDVDSFKDGDVVCVGWQDFTPGVPDILVWCFWVPKPPVESLPPSPPHMPTEGGLTPAQPGAGDLYTPDPAPLKVILLTPDPVNVSNSPDVPSGQHDFPGAGEYDSSWDLAINSNAKCLTDGFPLVWTVWAEDFTKLVYSLSKDGKAWTEAKATTIPDDHTRFPSAYVDANGVMYIGTTQSFREPEVFVTASEDCGATWGEPVNLSQNSGFSDAPHAAVTTDGKVHLVNDDDTTNSDFADIHYNQCTRDGNKVTCAEGSKPIAKFGGFPHIATDGNQTLYVAYSSSPGGKDGGVGFTCSADSGAKWKPQEELPDSTVGAPTLRTDTGIHHMQVKLAVAGQNVYLAWIQFKSRDFTKLQLSKRTGC